MNAHPTELAAARPIEGKAPPAPLAVEQERAPFNAKRYEQRWDRSTIVVQIVAPTFMDCAKACSYYWNKLYPHAEWHTKFQRIEEKPDGSFVGHGERTAVANWY